MDKAISYFNEVQKLLQKTMETQLPALEQAAQMVSDSLSDGGWLYLFGTGHSHMLAEEMFYRAGGLARVKPILDEGLMLHAGAVKSTSLERLQGYADILLHEYGIGSNDTMIIISNSGRNSVCVEMAIGAKALGASTIALTNLNHSSACESRHSSGKRLFELADVVLDNGGCYGDACISFNGRKAAPTSTVIGAALLNALECAVVERMQQNGQTVELYASSNVPNGDMENAQLIQKYRGVIRSL